MFQLKTGLSTAAVGIRAWAPALSWVGEMGTCSDAPAWNSKVVSGFFFPIHVELCVGQGNGFGKVS